MENQNGNKTLKKYHFSLNVIFSIQSYQSPFFTQRRCNIIFRWECNIHMSPQGGMAGFKKKKLDFHHWISNRQKQIDLSPSQRCIALLSWQQHHDLPMVHCFPPLQPSMPASLSIRAQESQYTHEPHPSHLVSLCKRTKLPAFICNFIFIRSDTQSSKRIIVSQKADFNLLRMKTNGREALRTALQKSALKI